MIEAESRTKAQAASAKEKDEETRKVRREKSELEDRIKELEAEIRRRDETVRKREKEKEELMAEKSELERSVRAKAEEKENLDRLLKEQKWGMKQRASQISQMEMAIREHQTDTTATIRKLEKALADGAEEGKEKDKAVENARDRVKEKEGIIAELRKNVEGVSAERVLLLGM